MSQISYTREELEQMDIFALRAIARNAGISSPTKKNKMELVNMILSVINGEVPPKPVKGRPPKPLKSKQEEEDDSYKPTTINPIPNIINEPADIEEEREGYLEINPDGYGFLRIKNGECNEKDAYVHGIKIKNSV